MRRKTPHTSPPRNDSPAGDAPAAPLPDLRFDFPLDRPHAGIALANGSLGLLVWGRGPQLNLTVGRTGFWDRRGATDFRRMSFEIMKQLLHSGNEMQVRQAFSAQPGVAELSPQQLPCGRIEVTLPANVALSHARFDADVLQIFFDRGDEPARLQIFNHTDLARLQLPRDLRDGTQVVFRPAWSSLENKLASRGYVAPSTATFFGVEVTTFATPADDALHLGLSNEDSAVLLAVRVGGDAVDLARHMAAQGPALDRNARATTVAFKRSCQELPRLNLPDPSLMRVYNVGIRRFLGLTHPSGVAATLQGPWMEEYQLPPWSNDYHFNINLQLCYWPALSLNRPDHLSPLWAMLRSWLPRMKSHADAFFGEEARALMLPHAVDDRCNAIGTYWQGTIDHASTAWMAHLAWLTYDYHQDVVHLRDTAWPLLVGAFNGFWRMFETRDDGTLSLPISVSPEYGEGAIGTWGRDASFQLAAVHAIARDLPQAAAALGEAIDPRWDEVSRRLPLYSTASIAPGPYDAPDPTRRRIALWDGQDLEFCHRHHSHLAGVWPFGVIDHADMTHRKVLEESLAHWTRLGAGAWSAWGLTWASMICARTDRADAAVAWLKWLIDNAETESSGIGISGLLGAMDNWCGPDDARRKPGEHFEIMQLDAQMGLIAAVHEILVHSAGDELRVLPRIPWRWREFEFDNLGAPGGFRIGATARDGVVRQIRIHSSHGRPLKLRVPFANPYWIDDRLAPITDRVLAMETRPGQSIVLNQCESKTP
jgi:alpha-L-fucosidase 2